ncbi:(4S)-4-hydroxy-5-phosphonooxypentane-2,3-dione isomerase [subsurface metagenome]
MIVTFVHVWVKPENLNDFVEACKANHLESVKETGNLRFDLLQDAQDPAKFVLYEAYESEEASKAHKDTAHYKIWRETVADWMARPREGAKHIIICPQERSKW